ncbi:hypothetical protein LCGC14_1396710, partial [marine sediment metagenome]
MPPSGGCLPRPGRHFAPGPRVSGALSAWGERDTSGPTSSLRGEEASMPEIPHEVEVAPA